MRVLRIPHLAVPILAVLLHAANVSAQNTAQSKPVLGAAPEAPITLLHRAASAPRKLDFSMSAVFNVNGGSREETREFYNAIYPASEGIPLDSTANTQNCDPGTNSDAFQYATLWRINWFRAMSGVPADITLSSAESAEDQWAALMISRNDILLHTDVPEDWLCFNESGTNAADHSNLALGLNGPDAITGYIADYGAENTAVGHRRSTLYPQTQLMANGDVPAQGTNVAANANWIYDEYYGGSRPETTYPFVSWPPPGYVPYPVVFPRWSFSLSNVYLADAVVTMKSNGVPLIISTEPYLEGYGENTLVWNIASLNPASYTTVFPFNGADTDYTITVTNLHTEDGLTNFTYDVTVFDPALRGPDFVTTLVEGTNFPFLNQDNFFACTPSANPNSTGYQWLTASCTNGNLADSALHGLTNFTISPPPVYSVITNPPTGSGHCFHLTHTNPAPQLLEFTEVLFPATNTTLSFKSLLGYATTNEVARVQTSTNDGATWTDIFAQKGTGGAGPTHFATNTLSLASCAAQITYVRFNYDYIGGPYKGLYFPDTLNTAGWCLESIILTNATQLVDFATNATDSTNFDFLPVQTGDCILEARGVIFNQFGLDWSPASQLRAVETLIPPVISIQTTNQVVSNAAFTVAGTAGDDFAVAAVYCQLNGGAWLPAGTANDWANWTEAVTLQPGSNTLAAYAVDNSGNFSVTNTLSVVYVVPLIGALQATVSPTAAATSGARWQLDGGTNNLSGATVTNLPAGEHTVTFTPTLGWFPPAAQTVAVKNAATTRITGPYKQAKPLLTISSPKSGQSVSNLSFLVTGAASDTGPLQSVHFLLNSNGWILATPGTSWSNWTAGVILKPGQNTFSAYVQDVSGSVSTTNTVKFECIPSATLAVLTNGNGAYSPKVNGETLAIGTNYTLTASAGKYWIFSKWVATGSENFVSTNPVLKFNMQSNLVLQANFVTNVFLAAQGTYNGLFAPTNAPRQQTNSGAFTFTLTTNGVVSGKLSIGTNAPAFSGQFNPAGVATLTSTRKGQTTLTTTLQLDFAGQSVQGMVSDGSFLASLDGDQEVFSSTRKAIEFEGQYTMIFPGTNEAAMGPFGTGYGTVTVSPTGGITFGGFLADGTNVSQSSAVSQNGCWPFYLTPYGSNGSFWSWNYFSNGTITSTNASWIVETNTVKNSLYAMGFTNPAASVAGAAYNPTNEPLLALTNGQITLTGGDLPWPVTNTFILTTNNTILTNAADTNKLTLTITKTSGLISGSFVNPANAKETNKFNGVLLQNQPGAAGYFLGSNQSGAFLLSPQ